MINILREKILDVKRTEEVVNIPEWSVEIKIKELSAKDKYDISGRVTNMESGKVDLAKMTAEFIIACVYDPVTGDKVFEETDLDTICSLPSSGVDKVFEKISNINKLEDIDETVKN